MLKSGNYKKILVIRNDRIGDLILSTPVIQALRNHFPESQIDFLVSRYAAEVIQGNPWVNEIIEDDKQRGTFKKLLKKIRTKKYDLAVILQSTARIGWMCLWAGIPHRIGPLSRWYNILFYNHSLRQHRSSSDFHEAEYNLQLLKLLGNIRTNFSSYIKPRRDHEIQESILKEKIKLASPFIICHPGLGGHALNWQPTFYSALIKQLLSLKNHKILMTGTHSDRPLIQQITSGFESQSNLIDLSEKTSLRLLIWIVQQASLVICPSTGILHMAVALQIPVISIFSPIQVQNKLRWGPFQAKKSRVFDPPVSCPAKYNCLGKKCRYYYCLDQIAPQSVFEEVKKILEL